jgi:UTP--glucose-1-phosphate uridylyltransferase
LTLKPNIKAIVVAAGHGTRVLPASKTIPKELFPLVDRPSLDLLIDEFIAAGIEDVILITSRRKKALEDYFDREIELETVLHAADKPDLVEAIAPPKLKVASIRQQEMLGTGHAILQAKPFIGGSPVIVAYPDDIFLGESFSKTLIEAYEATGKSVLGVVQAGPEIRRLSSISYEGDQPPFVVKGIVEKPAPGTELSNLASIGRYLFAPEFFEFLEEGWQRHLKEGAAGEYYHIWAINRLAERGQLVATFPKGKRLDVGVPETYIEAFIEYALATPRWRQKMLDVVSDIYQREL